jgi:hypothetical protein
MESDSPARPGLVAPRQFSRRSVLGAGAAALAAAARRVEPSLAHTTSGGPQKATALVLSGGGAKGAFELGAVTYLYGTGVNPDIMRHIGRCNQCREAGRRSGRTRRITAPSGQVCAAAPICTSTAIGSVRSIRISRPY